MKKLLPLLLPLLLSVPAFAQKNVGQNFHWVSEQWCYGISGGQFHPDLKALNDQLAIWKGNDQGLFYQGLRGYGLTAAEPFNVSRGGMFDGAYAFDMMMPAKVSIGKNDSLTYTMKGWNAMTSIYGKDVIPGKTVALVLAPGLDWGTLKMIRSLNGNGGLYKNAYLDVLGRAELRFVFSFISLGARGCYRYDLTNSAWKQKNGPASPIPGVKNTGTSIEFFVGWGRVHFQ